MEEKLSETNQARAYTPLLLGALAVPLFVWSAFNAGFFDLDSESFIIPLAVFFGAPLAVLGAFWAREAHFFRSTMAGAFGGFWLTYGLYLWLRQTGVVENSTAHMVALFFTAWAVTFAILWLGSVREAWTYSLVSLGSAVMLALLAIAYFGGGTTFRDIGGWVGFVTAGLAWYASLAEILNLEYRRPILPTDWTWFRRTRPGHR